MAIQENDNTTPQLHILSWPLGRISHKGDAHMKYCLKADRHFPKHKSPGDGSIVKI